MDTRVDIWMLVAGLGVFLFGMFMLEDSLKRLSGRTFRRWIKTGTGTLTKSILTGAGTTAVIQSSSAVSLMVLALVGAGILAMENAIGVILGSNLGTTFTTWLVAMLGFKIEIQRFAFPFIGVGGLGIIFLKNSATYSNVSRFLVGFGFIFLGIDFMKTSVEALSSGWTTSIRADSPLWLFAVAGIAVAAITQSSSATLAMALTSLHTGLISFEQAALVVIGANVGTTITVFIGALGGEQLKKQVALGHIIFNLVTGIVAVFLLKPFSWIVNDLMELHDNPELSIAAFHTLFNLFGVVLFAPLTSRLTKVVRWAYPERKARLALFVSRTDPAVSDAAIEATKRELKRMASNVAVLHMEVLGLDYKLIVGRDPERISFRDAEDLYDKIKFLHGEITEFGIRVTTSDLNPDEARNLQNYLQCARSLLVAAKQAKDIAHYLNGFELTDSVRLEDWKNELRKSSLRLYSRLFEVVQSSRPVHEDFAPLIEQCARDDEHLLAIINGAIGNDLQDATVFSNALMTGRLIHRSRIAILEGIRDSIV